MVAAISLMTALTSFATHCWILFQFGAGSDSAAFFAAIVPPVMVYEIFTLTFSMVLVPLFSPLDPAARRRAAWSWTSLLTLAMVLPCAALVAGAPLLVEVCFPGFSPATKALAGELFLPISLALFPLAAIEGLSSGYRAGGRFIYPEFASWISSILSLLFLAALSDRWGIHAAAGAFLLRSSAEFLLLAFGWWPVFPRWSSLQFALVLSRVKHLFLGSCVHRTDSLFDRYLTSYAAAGSVSLLAISRQLIHTSSRLLTRSITWTCIPTLARHAHDHDWNRFRTALDGRTRWILAIAAVGILLLVLCGPTLVPLLFQHGQMTSADTQSIFYLLLALSGTLVGESLANLYCNAFYACGNTSVPTRLHIACYLLGLAFRGICFLWFGVLGTAIGLSVYYLLFAGLLMWQLRVSLRRQEHPVPALPSAQRRRKVSHAL